MTPPWRVAGQDADAEPPAAGYGAAETYFVRLLLVVLALLGLLVLGVTYGNVLGGAPGT